jgi:hypothetical protein
MNETDLPGSFQCRPQTPHFVDILPVSCAGTAELVCTSSLTTGWAWKGFLTLSLNYLSFLDKINSSNIICIFDFQSISSIPVRAGYYSLLHSLQTGFGH